MGRAGCWKHIIDGKACHQACKTASFAASRVTRGGKRAKVCVGMRSAISGVGGALQRRQVHWWLTSLCNDSCLLVSTLDTHTVHE